MAAKRWVVALLAGIGGFVLAPFLWAALTGAAAGLLAGVGFQVPAFLGIGAGLQAMPVIALVGGVLAVGWVLK